MLSIPGLKAKFQILDFLMRDGQPLKCVLGISKCIRLASLASLWAQAFWIRKTPSTVSALTCAESRVWGCPLPAAAALPHSCQSTGHSSAGCPSPAGLCAGTGVLLERAPRRNPGNSSAGLKHAGVGILRAFYSFLLER